MNKSKDKVVYSNVFKNIKKEVVLATKELIQSGIWDESVEMQDRFISMGLWIHKVSKLYGMEPPKIYFVGGEDGKQKYQSYGGGTYQKSIHTIFLYRKLSFVTLLHEFRHAMQHKKSVIAFNLDYEEDARAWSMSLYRLSAPTAHKKAVESGKVRFV